MSVNCTIPFPGPLKVYRRSGALRRASSSLILFFLCSPEYGLTFGTWLRALLHTLVDLIWLVRCSLASLPSSSCFLQQWEAVKAGKVQAMVAKVQLGDLAIGKVENETTALLKAMVEIPGDLRPSGRLSEDTSLIRRPFQQTRPRSSVKGSLHWASKPNRRLKAKSYSPASRLS